MPNYWVTLSRKRTYMEEACVFVNARSNEEAMANAFDLVDAHEADFIQEPSGVDHEITDLKVIRVEEEQKPPPSFPEGTC